MSTEEVLELAFTYVETQLQNDSWMLEHREAIEAQIEEGFEQTERGETDTPEEARRVL